MVQDARGEPDVCRDGSEAGEGLPRRRCKEMQQLLDAENGYWYSAHPRTKGTAGYPDANWNEAFVKNDRYLGVAYKMGMGIDLSEIRTCEWRCFDAIDTMNNMNTGTGLRPKLHHR